MVVLPSLSNNEWAVLGTLRTSAGHGFAAAHELSPEGSIGRVWSVSRPLVYRGISHLIEAGLLDETGTAPGRSGPVKRLLALTSTGEQVFDAWLDQPVRHIRDYRSELMLKLLFLDGNVARSRRFLEAQREELAPILSGLERQLDEASGFDVVLARWRLSAALAAEEFLEELLTSLRRPTAV